MKPNKQTVKQDVLLHVFMVWLHHMTFLRWYIYKLYETNINSEFWDTIKNFKCVL